MPLLSASNEENGSKSRYPPSALRKLIVTTGHQTPSTVHKRVSCLELINLVSRQLNKDPDHCCRPLGKEGLHGSLFAITFDTYRYTFVGKGTEYDSHYEGDIYQVLKQLQGTAVPVYLGDIYLRESVYFLGPFCEIIHMSLMAWVGESIDDELWSSWDTEIGRTVSEVYDAGIEHLDVRPENLLWSEEMQRVMLVDFGRVGVHRKRRSSVLSDVSPNSKKKKVEY